jgi:2-amino-4-hydroxy-6-hydroxymethyldihydropteridine diphosphokinase
MKMILVAIGSNVPGPWGTPRQSVERALAELDRPPCRLIRASRLIVTSPMGELDQPAFVNAVAVITTALEPADLLAHLHDIELAADRRRTLRWGPRTLDLDLIDHDGRIIDEQDGIRTGHGVLVLPHPGIANRAFVLGPIAETVPDWRHPVTGETAAEMLARLGEGEAGREIGDEGR